MQSIINNNLEILNGKEMPLILSHWSMTSEKHVKGMAVEAEPS